MRKFFLTVIAAFVMAAPLGAVAQAPAPMPAPSSNTPPPLPPLPYGLGISMQAAKKGLAAAEAEAKKNSWTVAIAIVDSSGKLTAFSKMDNTPHASVDLAIGKAVTANNLKRPTKALQDNIALGGVNLRILGQPGITPLEGGVPVIADGRIIGAIGVSGVMSNQDAQVAIAGATAAVE